MKRFLGCLTFFLGLTTTLFHLFSFFNGKWERRNWFWKEENIYFSIENIDEDYWRLYVNRTYPKTDSDYIEFRYKNNECPPEISLLFPVNNPTRVYITDRRKSVKYINAEHSQFIYLGRTDFYPHPRNHKDSIVANIPRKSISLGERLKSISYWDEQGKWQRNISEIE